MEPRRVLVVGATGYVGSRLVPKLLEAGYIVRAYSRSIAKLGCRPWAMHPMLEAAEGDVRDMHSLRQAAEGCWAAFYLVHSMTSSEKEFAEADRLGSLNMATAAAAARMNRIIYLGGLGVDSDPRLSKHLRSRNEVARILRSGPIPVTVLRAAMILGSGSASFELMRYLVDRLPIMITPKWVRTPVQPIGIRNVLNYLVGCLDHDEVIGETFDIGGPDIVTYEQLFHEYAEVAGLQKRVIIPVPMLTPRLSAIWIHLFTPVPASIARPLGEGLWNKAVCRENRIIKIIPQEMKTARQVIELALERIQEQKVESCWSDAGKVIPPEWLNCGDAEYAGGTILQCGYLVRLEATPEEVWPAVIGIGGERGWYFADPLWNLRGWLDTLIGGTGLRRGRRDPNHLFPGDALDFWRVLEVDAPHRLLLLAEMKTPGEAVLEFQLTKYGGGQTELRQLSRFSPRGLAGMAYWYSLYPAHELIFQGMLKGIARSVGKKVTYGPERFDPTVQNVCNI